MSRLLGVVIVCAALLPVAGRVAVASGADQDIHSVPRITIDSPLYKAGIDRDDLIVSIAGTRVTTQDALNQVLGQQQPGAKLPIRFVRRSGETVNGSIVLDEDPNVEIVPIEQTGGVLTEVQKRFRDDWLGSKQ